MFKEFFDALWYLAYIAFVGIGIVLYVASKFAKFLPTFGAYKLPAEIGGIVLLFLGAWLGGGYANEKEWEEKLLNAKQQAAKAEAKAKIVNKEIQIEYRDRVQTVTDVRTKIETRIQTVTEYIDRECKVTEDARQIHNDAAQGKVTVEKK